jgi:hypothetical protein
MADLATISAALSSLKTATEIVKLIRESDLTLERAELKLKLADLLSSLADAKIELIQVQDALLEKDKRIVELEDAFQNKDKFVRQYDAYYNVDENGKPTGVSYCLRCWETNFKKRQLVHSFKDYSIRVCTSCGHQYENRLTGDIQPTPKS